MPTTKKRPAPRGCTPTAYATKSAGVVALPDDRAKISRYSFECPICEGGNADATYGKYGPDWLVGCFSPSCRALGGEYLARLAAEVGAPNGAAIKSDPLRWLDGLLRGSRTVRRSGKATGKVPGEATFDGWHENIWHETAALAYLRSRGISRKVIARARIGFDRKYGWLVFPIRNDGEIVAYKTRYPRDGVQMRNRPSGAWRGALYPEPQERDRWVLLVAGEMDALAARSRRFPACSVTLGAGYWREEWTGLLDGRPVVVCFDNNERDLAKERVVELKDAGLAAYRLDLRRIGLREPKGDLSDYLSGGGSAVRLARHIRRQIESTS